MKKGKILIPIIIVVILFIIINIPNKKYEIRTVKNEKELYQLYKGREVRNLSLIERLLTMPFSTFIENDYYYTYEGGYRKGGDFTNAVEEGTMATDVSTTSSSKDYSKTNIQVEGVDEADILKTDGDYIYSISDNKVIITDVKDSDNPEIEAKIYNDKSIPTDLILYKNKLVIISTEANPYISYYYNNKNNTVVEVYDLSNKKNPKLTKSFELEEPYHTTRCIDGKLYIFSNGYLREEDNKKKIKRDYKEDNKTKKISLDNIYYINNRYINKQTLIAELDLNNIKDVKISSYLIDLTNAYISKDNIYLLNQEYTDSRVDWKSIFGWKGVFGLIGYIDDSSSSYDTKIYKFNIDKNKGVTYQTNTKIEGRTINQYSLDEKDGNLRIALETYDGTRVAVLNKNLKLLGETEKLEENENMYASRFIGDKAYLVTYRNTDPLFVIDLSNPKKPEVLGELKIPGYSSYLHPYDENHLIGIGMETEEIVDKDINGNVISNRAIITGMKMSLFDISDVNNPIEIDKTVIGDSRTVSAILSNPKALLFSKEKELLAIPVNNYQEDFQVEQTDNYEEEIDRFTGKTDYISEGYFVYHIDLNGFNLKGTITHENNNNKNDYYYYYRSKLLRGLYIDDNLYTVSETEIKVNELDDLSEISNIKINEGEQ